MLLIILTDKEITHLFKRRSKYASFEIILPIISMYFSQIARIWRIWQSESEQHKKVIYGRVKHGKRRNNREG